MLRRLTLFLTIALAGLTLTAASQDQWAPLGDYTVTLTVGGRTLTQTATISKTQGWSMGIRPQIVR